MTLLHWPLVVIGLAIALTLAVLWHRRGHGRRETPTGAYAAHTDRLRGSARYLALVRAALRRSGAAVAAVAVLAAGGLVLAGRPVDAASSPETRHNRDIMLCLDVSGSMKKVDRDMLRAFAGIVRDLRGERIGLTLWDSSSVLVFPLTDDHTHIEEQLRATADALETHSDPLLSGASAGDGSSLIGDGLVSCLQRFDRLGEPRSRAVVLATDNKLSGSPAYPLPAAVDLAVRHGIAVHGVAAYESDEVSELRGQLARTHGELYLLPRSEGATAIVRAIEATEARRLAGLGAARVTDVPWPGAVLATLGLLVLVWADIVRPGRRPGGDR